MTTLYNKFSHGYHSNPLESHPIRVYPIEPFQIQTPEWLSPEQLFLRNNSIGIRIVRRPSMDPMGATSWTCPVGVIKGKSFWRHPQNKLWQRGNFWINCGYLNVLLLTKEPPYVLSAYPFVCHSIHPPTTDRQPELYAHVCLWIWPGRKRKHSLTIIGSHIFRFYNASFNLHNIH